MSDGKKKSSSRSSTREDSVVDNDGTWWDAARASVQELWSCFLIGFLAAGSNVWTRQSTGHSLAPLAYGAAFGLLIFATGMVSHGLAWFISPNVLLTHWFSTKPSELTWTLFCHYTIMGIFSLGGWFLAAWAFWAITGGDIDNAAALANLDDFWTIFFIELVGQIFINQVYLATTLAVDGSFKYLTMGALYTVLVGIFFNITGGSFNFWRSLSFQVVLGVTDWTVLGAVLFATLASPIIAVAIQSWVFSDRNQGYRRTGETYQEKK